MSAPLQPASFFELVEAVRATPRLIAVGAGTKPRLSDVEVVKLSTARLCGIVEYEPSEFTFTALAGTPVREITAALAERGQYLPFDPMLAQAGATIGGTVASGLSGPGRFRYGGLRDFILGVRFADGVGRLLRMGGKVVKNAAGFDLPKFFVGSLGRFGVLVEITFKVFPRRASQLTLRLEVKNFETAARIVTEASNARWEVDALDCPPGAQCVCLRLAGPDVALHSMADEILNRWPGEVMPETEADALWDSLREFHWAHTDGFLLKVPLTPGKLVPLRQSLDGWSDGRVHISAGGNVAYISLGAGTPVATLQEKFRQLGLSALTLRGAGPLWWNVGDRPRIVTAVKTAIDCENRFPSLDD